MKIKIVGYFLITQGTIKGLTVEQVEELGPAIILGNTYHLGHRPGTFLEDFMVDST